MKEHNLLNITPVETYTAPSIPTLDEACGDTALLKKLPSRWKKNAAVIACAGIIGMTALTGCGVLNDRYDDWIHHGGAASAPMYVVYLTEQETLSVIREQLEAAGLNFDAEPPNYTAEVRSWLTVGLDLFDSERNVAIASGVMSRNFAEQAVEEFAKQTDITVGVFLNYEEEFWNRPTDEERVEILAGIENHLIVQVQEFIELLRDKGIL